MHKMEELKEMLCRELEEITKKGELSAGSLDAVDKLTHSIKSIETIMAMNDYSQEGSNRGSYRRSYARDGYAGEEGYSRYANRGSYRRGYSRNEDLKNELREMQKSIQDPESQRMISEWMRELEQ